MSDDIEKGVPKEVREVAKREDAIRSIVKGFLNPELTKKRAEEIMNEHLLEIEGSFVSHKEGWSSSHNPNFTGIDDEEWKTFERGGRKPVFFQFEFGGGKQGLFVWRRRDEGIMMSVVTNPSGGHQLGEIVSAEVNEEFNRWCMEIYDGDSKVSAEMIDDGDRVVFRRKAEVE